MNERKQQFCNSYPSPQNSIELFNNWASVLPVTPGNYQNTGKYDLFHDKRIDWANEQFGGFKGMNVLELGPLEGGHSYMIERLGAESILAIEANKESYLKCLIVKELYGLNKCHFVLGDFVKYLRETNETYDFVLGSGVLYHMINPVELIALVAKVSSNAMFWTHYYDENAINKMPHLKRHFSKGENSDFAGFTCTRFKHRYLFKWLYLWGNIFYGGTDTYSYWLKADDIVSCLKYFGFKKVSINYNEIDHPNGPCFCLACKKD